LLVVYMAGSADLAIIDTHKRLREFLKSGYGILA
jgi:ABC-type tungstate transport system permease subunit